MNWFADTLRAVTVLLAICYMPLLYLRVKRTPTTINVIHLFGTFFFAVAIIVASYQSKGNGFHYAQPFNFAGLIVVNVSGTLAEREYKKNKKNS